jgi:outer membrane putative beta-barrel porin/alpha-amylase
MPPSAAPCARARTLFFLVLLARACEALAQADPRDALIEDLQRRIEALEKRLEEKPAPPPPPAPAEAAKPPAAAAAPKPGASEQAGSEDENARALERSLVREGGLVLPKGTFEIEPRLQYTYRASEGLRIVTAGGAAQVAEQDIRRNDAEASLGLRVGLPAAFQAEVRMPYVWIHENRATSSLISESESASGLGDVELGLSKQFLADGPGRVGLLGSLTWKSVTGHQETGRLSPGTGFPQLQAALTAVKRQDPLVFFGTATYSRNYERERDGVQIDPGDGFGFRAGTLLAASPETSLRATFDMARTARTKVGGSDIPGSDTTAGVLEFGVATLLSRRTLLDVQLGIGITPDAPDYRLRLALPIRF